jgi:hypothetical protein
MWAYDHKSRTTGDGDGLVPRTRIEEAAEALHSAGFSNRPLIVDVLVALSGLRRGEVKFNVDLALDDL